MLQGPKGIPRAFCVSGWMGRWEHATSKKATISRPRPHITAITSPSHTTECPLPYNSFPPINSWMGKPLSTFQDTPSLPLASDPTRLQENETRISLPEFLAVHHPSSRTDRIRECTVVFDTLIQSCIGDCHNLLPLHASRAKMPRLMAVTRRNLGVPTKASMKSIDSTSKSGVCWNGGGMPFSIRYLGTREKVRRERTVGYEGAGAGGKEDRYLAVGVVGRDR